MLTLFQISSKANKQTICFCTESLCTTASHTRIIHSFLQETTLSIIHYIEHNYISYIFSDLSYKLKMSSDLDSDEDTNFHGFGKEGIPGRIVIETEVVNGQEILSKVHREKRRGRPRGGATEVL